MSEDDIEIMAARRESPDNHPNDHIDVVADVDGEARLLRFDVAAETARFRYEDLSGDEIALDTDGDLIRVAAQHIYEEMGVDAEVSVPAPDLADGVVRSKHIAEV